MAPDGSTGPRGAAPHTSPLALPSRAPAPLPRDFLWRPRLFRLILTSSAHADSESLWPADSCFAGVSASLPAGRDRFCAFFLPWATPAWSPPDLAPAGSPPIAQRLATRAEGEGVPLPAGTLLVPATLALLPASAGCAVTMLSGRTCAVGPVATPSQLPSAQPTRLSAYPRRLRALDLSQPRATWRKFPGCGEAAWRELRPPRTAAPSPPLPLPAPAHAPPPAPGRDCEARARGPAPSPPRLGSAAWPSPGCGPCRPPGHSPQCLHTEGGTSDVAGDGTTHHFTETPPAPRYAASTHIQATRTPFPPFPAAALHPPGSRTPSRL